MTRLTAVLSAIVLGLGLVACSAEKTDDGSSKNGDTTTNGAETSTPAGSETGQPGTDMPTLDTSGPHPILAFPDSNPPEGLQVEVLEEGTGRVVEETDYVVAHYEGQVWGNAEPFDSSFERQTPTGFSLQQVIAGWTEGLSGQKVGSKVILSIPTELGYSEGNPGAGIQPGDTIAFYVEIHDSFGLDQAGDPKASIEADGSDLPVDIDGELGEPVAITLKDGVEAPQELSETVIASGSGEPVGGPGTIVYVQYAAAFWDSDIVETTYGAVGPQAPSIGSGSLFDALEGIPVGSRVLVLVPASESGEDAGSNTAPAFAVVVDILGQTKANAPAGAEPSDEEN